MLVDLRGQLRFQIGGERVGVLQHGVHEAAELGAHRQIGHRRGDVGAGRRCGQCDVGDLVVEFDDLRFAADSDALLRGAHQAGVGGAPPRGVDGAVEVPDGEVLPCGARGHLDDRRGLLDDLDHRTAGLLPLAEPRERLVVGDGVGRAPVGDDGLAGTPVAHQPGQPAVGFVARRRPPRDDLSLGPGHRHIHQAAVVAGRLPAAQHRDLVVVGGALAADVQTAGLAVVEQDLVALLHIAVERERQIDDRELQTLAAVHGHHLDGGGVAVEALVVLRRAVALLAAIAQPVPQRRQCQVLAVCGLLQQLGHVCHIGHVPLTVSVGKRAVGHAAQSCCLEHRGHAAGAGVVRPFPDGVGDAVGERIPSCGKGFSGVAEEHGGSGGPDHTGAVRLIERLQ